MSEPVTLDTLVMLSDGQARPLIQVLEGMGAKRVNSRPDDWGVDVLSVDESGTYLVLPLPTSQEQT